MPVLLLIVAGTVEVTNMLTLYDEVQVATREAARFASQGGPDNAVMTVVKQAVQNTPVTITDPEMNVWIARPVMSVTPSGCTSTCSASWTSYTDNCIYPINGSGVGTCTNTNPVSSSKVLTDLMVIKNDSLDQQRLVVVVIRYEAQTILNLRMFGNTNGRFPVYAYAVMRQEVSQTASNQLTAGCSTYPIIIYDGQLTNLSEDKQFTPPWNGLTIPSTQGFGFVSWDKNGIPATKPAVTSATPVGSLPFPGNSLNGSYGYHSGAGVKRGDLVYSNPAAVSDATSILNNHKAVSGSPSGKPRALRVMTYSDTPVSSGVGSIYQYTVTGFAIVRIQNFSGSTITFSWVSWDSSCGFVVS